jgi:hypothetical protein
VEKCQFEAFSVEMQLSVCYEDCQGELCFNQSLRPCNKSIWWDQCRDCPGAVQFGVCLQNASCRVEQLLNAEGACEPNA